MYPSTSGFRPAARPSLLLSVVRRSPSIIIAVRNTRCRRPGSGRARERGLVLSTRAWMRSPTCWALAKKSLPSGRRISRPSNVSSSGCSGESGRRTSAPALAADHMDPRMAAWLDRPSSDRTIATTMPCRVPNSEHAKESRQCPTEFHRADLADRRELGRLDQADRIDDHDCREDACGSSPSSGARTSIVAAEAAAVTSDAFCVRPPTARTTAVCDVPPPAGMAPKKAPARLAAPVASSSRFGSIGGSARRGEGAPGGNRFGEAHQRDAERARQHLPGEGEVGQRHRRQRLGNVAHRGDAGAAEAEQPRHGNTGADHHERRRRMRPDPLHRQQQEQSVTTRWSE